MAHTGGQGFKTMGETILFVSKSLSHMSFECADHCYLKERLVLGTVPGNDTVEAAVRLKLHLHTAAPISGRDNNVIPHSREM